MPPLDAPGLRVAAQQLDCTLSDNQAQQLLRYLELLQQWNQVYNLTAVRDPGQMGKLHLLDSLSVIAPLRRHAKGRALRLLDVGSGGGLPGVVIAITEPDWTVHCVDTVAKKARFIQQVAIELPAPKLHALHSRVEALAAAGAAARFDVVISRAFASLADFTRLSAHCLVPDGCWLAMKGKLPADEMAALPADIEVFHVEPLQVPGLDAERCAIWMRPRR